MPLIQGLGVVTAVASGQAPYLETSNDSGFVSESSANGSNSDQLGLTGGLDGFHFAGVDESAPLPAANVLGSDGPALDGVGDSAPLTAANLAAHTAATAVFAIGGFLSTPAATLNTAAGTAAPRHEERTVTWYSPSDPGYPSNPN
jgi:hypothetical protein